MAVAFWRAARKLTQNTSSLPDPDRRWIAQKSAPDHGPNQYVPPFVLKMNDSIHHSFVHVKIQPPRVLPPPLGDVLKIEARKYNSLTDEWSVLMQGSFQMPETISDYATIHSLAFQSETESLFVLFEDRGEILKMYAIINYGTNSVETFPITTTLYSTLLNLDGIVHVTQSELIRPSPVNMIPQDKGEAYLVTTIHVPSQKVILKFYMHLKKVRNYCRVTRKWSTLSITWNLEDRHSFIFRNATLTSDEQQIIIFADEHLPNKRRFRSRIMALNMDDSNYSFSVSDIPCTSIDPDCIMRTGGGLCDEKLVIGWIRILFGSSEYKGLAHPPLYLMQMIAKWYSREMIHAFHFNGKHYAIPLDVIRSTLSPLVAAEHLSWAA